MTRPTVRSLIDRIEVQWKDYCSLSDRTRPSKNTPALISLGPEPSHGQYIMFPLYGIALLGRGLVRLKNTEESKECRSLTGQRGSRVRMVK